MAKTILKNKVSITNIASVIGLGLVCSVSLTFFGYQIFNSVLLTGPETIDKSVTCDAPLPIGSSFYQEWPLRGIDCAWQAFYMTNGLNNESNGVIAMSKETDYIRDLAEQIDTLGTPHDTVQNIMNWMHDDRYGGIKGVEHPNCNGISEDRFVRTAEEVIRSKCAVGCTQWTLAFVALARAKGIPAAMTETVSNRWINESISNGCMNRKQGHLIADVYTGVSNNGGWELADPTGGYFTVYEYNDFAGYALMRFNSYDTEESPQPFGSGYRYSIMHRGIDSWDFGMTSDETWTQAVIERYGVPNNVCEEKSNDDKILEGELDWIWKKASINSYK